MVQVIVLRLHKLLDPCSWNDFVCAVGKRIPHGAILAQIEALNLPHCALPLGSVAPNLEANHLFIQS